MVLFEMYYLIIPPNPLNHDFFGFFLRFSFFLLPLVFLGVFDVLAGSLGLLFSGLLIVIWLSSSSCELSSSSRCLLSSSRCLLSSSRCLLSSSRCLLSSSRCLLSSSWCLLSSSPPSYWSSSSSSSSSSSFSASSECCDEGSERTEPSSAESFLNSKTSAILFSSFYLILLGIIDIFVINSFFKPISHDIMNQSFYLEAYKIKIK